MDRETDIIKIETDIKLVDKNGNIIIVETSQPELAELWV